MPNFSTPFGVKKCDKKLTPEEVIRAIRFSIASEYEAIQIYEEIIESVNCQKTIQVLNEIIEDEKIHVGNFLHLLNDLSTNEMEAYKEGCKEAELIIKDI